MTAPAIPASGGSPYVPALWPSEALPAYVERVTLPLMMDYLLELY